MKRQPLKLRKGFTAFIIVILVVSFLASISFFVVPVRASSAVGLDGQGSYSIPLIPVTNSDNPNYTFMANGTCQSYFRNDSKTTDAVRFQYKGYTFDMDISTSLALRTTKKEREKNGNKG